MLAINVKQPCNGTILRHARAFGFDILVEGGGGGTLEKIASIDRNGSSSNYAIDLS